MSKDDDRKRERHRQLLRLEAERRLYEADLLTFAKAAWTIVEPQNAFEPNWHHQLVAEYLTLAAQGEIRRLIINMPPRHTKSRLVTVIWPCWVWAQRPGTSWVFSSFSALLSKQQHSHERRLILESEWYLDRWGRRVEIAPGQNRQDEYQNTERGTMVATSTGGTVTGKGGNFIVVDDPVDPQRAYSDAERQTANDYFDQTLYTRQNDPRTSVFVIVMQRLHNADLTGHVLEEKADLPWTVVDLQAEAEKAITITFPRSGKVVSRLAGDLLWPTRFTPAVLADHKQRLGSWGYSAQFQQRAVPHGGGVFKRDWWHFWGGPCARCTGIEHGLPGTMDEALQSWDCSFKDTEGSDFVSGQVWARRKADLFLLDRVNDRMNFPATISAVETMSGKWPGVLTKLVEDKANGPAVIATLQHRVPGLIEVEPQGGKLARAHAASPVVESGNCYIPHPQRAPWVHDWLEQLSSFPKGAHDDDVDAATQAILRLAGYYSGMGYYSLMESQVAARDQARATSETILTP